MDMQIIFRVAVIINLILTGCTSFPGKNNHYEQAADDNVRLGLVYLANNNYTAAKEKLLLALQEAPNSPIELDAMAYYLTIIGETQQAELFYRRALARNPNSGAALNNYGVFLCYVGNYQQANYYLLRAANKTDYINTAQAYENLGLCAKHKGNTAVAKFYLAKAIEQDPSRK